MIMRVLRISFMLTLSVFTSRSTAGYVRYFDNYATTVALEHAAPDASATVILSMTNVAFGVWELEMPWPTGTNEYRFVIDEKLTVSDIGNRDHTTHADGSVWSRVVIGEQQDQPSDKNNDHKQPVKVLIEYFNPEAKQVQIAGEFNGWSLDPMRRVREGLWRADMKLGEGDYGYKLIVDGEWMFDPSHDRRKIADGIENSLLSVSTNMVYTPLVPDDSAPEQMMEVEFSLYAPLEQHVSVVGTFNDWNGESHPMEKAGDAWRCQIPLPEGNYEYKFKAGDRWILDPNNPDLSGGKSSGNSVLVVTRPPDEAPATSPLIDPAKWRDRSPILLEPGGRLHPFQQELLRAWIYIQAADGHGLSIADGTLLQTGPVQPPASSRWTWNQKMDNARPVMRVGVDTNTLSFQLTHPLVAAPHVWLAELRRNGHAIISPGFDGWSGPTSPPPDSAWATARQVLRARIPMADAFAINKLTEFGRAYGWSPELVRDLAITYADMAHDHRYPSMGGWAANVFAARAVVYAELARAQDAPDETMAYVLARIGRPADAKEFLPETPEGFHGKLAEIMAQGRRDELLKVVGTPDHYGFDLAKGMESIAPAMTNESAWQKAALLRTMFELLDSDEQRNMSRMYLDASLKIQPRDFAGHRQAMQAGGVSAGHRHAQTLLGLAGNKTLWKSSLAGSRPSLFEAKTLVTSPRAIRQELKQATDRDISEISNLYKEQFRTVSDVTKEPIPQAARLILLRDMLNFAWWYNADFYGNQLYSQPGCENLNRLMSSWKPMHPEMEGITRFLMRAPLSEHPYKAVREGLEKNARGPDTLSFIALVRNSFTTWLLESAQELYPHVPIVQSDLLPDYLTEYETFDFLGMDQCRVNIRRLSPMNSRGYPAPGEKPTIGNNVGIPDELIRSSFGLNKRLAQIWNLDGNPASRKHTLDFYRQCLEIAPYETSIYRTMAGVFMDNGRYTEALELVDSFPETTEGLESTAMQRLGAIAALDIGDTNRAVAYAKSAANSGQGGAMLAYAYILEVTGQAALSLSIQKAQSERYDDEDVLYYYSRTDPAKAAEKATEVFSWIEQFPDLQKANDENKFSFNEFKELAFYYGALGRWDKALWLLKPLSEAVQNDYIWFLLMTVAQKTGDKDAESLAEHVLANHVQNVFGECARFNRGTRSWSDVVNASRVEGRPQPVFLFASLLAEERGDIELARRLQMHAINPRFGLSGWFTMAWNEYRRLGGDPVAFALRNVPVETTQQVD